MAAFQRRGNAWRAQVRMRGHALSATFDTHEEARAWAAAQEAKLLAGAKAKDGRAAFLTPADLFRPYRDEVSPRKRGGRWEAVRLDMLCRSAPFGVPLRDFGPEDVARWRDGRLGAVAVPDGLLEGGATLCAHLGTDGLRGELTLLRATRALAALEGTMVATDALLRRIAPAALRHRLRRNPLDDTGSTARVDRAVRDVFGA